MNFYRIKSLEPFKFLFLIPSWNKTVHAAVTNSLFFNNSRLANLQIGMLRHIFGVIFISLETYIVPVLV